MQKLNTNFQNRKKIIFKLKNSASTDSFRSRAEMKIRDLRIAFPLPVRS